MNSYEEKYGNLILAAETLAEEQKEKLEEEHKKVEESLNFKLKTLESMFLNVCRHVYMLKSNIITIDQLLSIVNGCLDPKIINDFTWLYLKTDDEKKKELSEVYKKVEEYNKNYLNDLMAELTVDEVDNDDDILQGDKDENGKYKIKFNAKVTNSTMQTFNNHDDLEELENLKVFKSKIEDLVKDLNNKTEDKVE